MWKVWRQERRRAAELEGSRLAWAASGREVMLLWRVDYLGKVLSKLGTISAVDEQSAIDKAAVVFHITPARRLRRAEPGDLGVVGEFKKFTAP